MTPGEKTLPQGADGDDSVAVENDVYSINIGETESGTWIWDYDGHATLYHEFFALQDGSGEVYRSYREATVDSAFPDTVEPGINASATLSMTVEGQEILVKRTVNMDSSDPTFTMKYDFTHMGDASIDDLRFFQYGDFDDGPNDFLDDVGRYLADSDSVFVRDSSGDAYAGFSGNRQSVNHHVGAYPGYDEVKNDELNNNSRYPQGDGNGDAVVVLEWSLGELSPDDSTSITLQFGASTDQEKLTSNIEEPDQVDTEPPGPQSEAVNASASIISYVPGLSENESKGGNDVYSAFPNQGPLPGLPIDEAFLGDKIKHTPITVEQALNWRKTVEDLDGEFRQFRAKNTLEISFDSDGEQRIANGAEIEVSVNSQQPEATNGSYLDFNIEVDIERSSVSLLDTTDPESPSTTILEENVNDHINLSIIDGTQIGENNRTQTAYAWPRYLNGTVDTFSHDGEEIEGVRVSTLWGTANPYTRDIANLTWILPGSNPIIYSWIDMVVLADGTYGVIVRDAPTFPLHSLYTGPAGEPDEQYERADSGLEILFDTDANTDKEYKAAINEDNHKPWGQFFGAFDDNTTYVPYRTPKKRYMKNYNNDSTGRWFGYKNEFLVDHPMMVYGEDSDGTELSNNEVESLLDPQLTPYPDLYPFF